jgi:hypothetical protein
MFIFLWSLMLVIGSMAQRRVDLGSYAAERRDTPERR